MTLRVAINGFGRIGEMFFRTVLRDPEGIEVVALNDIIPLDQLEYLLRFDSVHPSPERDIRSGDGWLRVDGHETRVFQASDPSRLPWADLGVDVVVESSGAFRTREGMQQHLAAGAGRVVLTAPAKGDGADVTLCVGINDGDYDPAAHRLISNASCTTNCLAPVARAIDDAFGIEWGLMTTVHAYTGSQALIDRANRRPRRGRAAAVNIVPTTTGAAQATGRVLPRLAGRIDGMAFRVPVPDGSVIDLVFRSERPLTREALHAALEAAAGDPSYRGVLATSAHPLVSSDILGSPRSAIVDLTSTLVLGDRAAKVVAFYDNEWGYACRVRDLVALIGQRAGAPAPT